MRTPVKFTRPLLWLIFLSLLVRGFVAATIEFNNDEVYYWTYALYPDWSHFDHPPMVGWFIQLFSLNLSFHSEFFIRLSSVVMGAVNTWLIFLIGKKIKNELTGWYAALLYNASVYCFVITGIFILPDTPQVFFWLLGLFCMAEIFTGNEVSSRKTKFFLLFGIVAGLAMISKYTSAFLWLAIWAMVIFDNRKWLKVPSFYLAHLLSLLIFSPVLLWNIGNNFISFTYQSERVGFFGKGLRLDYFFTELFGEILYNNPVNFILILLMLVALIRKKKFVQATYQKLLLFSSLPLIGTFLFLALFRSTLPHWTGPAYLSLMLLAAAFFAENSSKKQKSILFPKEIIISLLLLGTALTASWTEINYGWINLDTRHTGNPQKMGEDDLTLDMYGWKQLKEKVEPIINQDKLNGKMHKPVIISYRWFPAANLDYYVAQPLGIKLYAVGTLERIHKYYWINHLRGIPAAGTDAYFITLSHDFKDPLPLYGDCFDTILPPDTLTITRCGKSAMNAFVYRMKKLKSLPSAIE
ncbi:MAG: glycosyltransferase family 39 protein [Lentimicrobiaceae bacterium]|nr:glycosyltransferase family 39 protein [Lentimicrobiaceae bacterium]